MTTVIQKTNRVSEAQGHLIDQFKNQANIEAVIKAFAQQSQELEDAAFEVINDTTLDNAVGVQLDGLADIVGIERGASGDSELRLRIRAQILVNKSSGTIEEILEILDTLGLASIVLAENFPAKIEIVIGTATLLGATAAIATNQARSGGVGLDFTWFEGATPFTFDTVGRGFDQGNLVGHMKF
jgi:hypothetical protein